MGGGCSTYREKKNACRVLMRKREGTRVLGRPRRTYDSKIKMVSVGR